MVGEMQECSVGKSCRNSITNVSESQAKCYLCRLAPDGENLIRDYWKPNPAGLVHPTLLKEKNDKKYKATKDRIAKRQNRSKDKIKMSRQAAKTEKDTADKIIKATKNSGRVNRDSDFSAVGFVTLDAKLQSTRINPEVDLGELDKAGSDARRAKNKIGGLVITNKFGVSIVVFTLEDFSSQILSRLING
jgi:hypothetical protein